MEVVCGKGYVEIKVKGVNKGIAAQIILQRLSSIRGQPDFVSSSSLYLLDNDVLFRSSQWEMTSLMNSCSKN